MDSRSPTKFAPQILRMSMVFFTSPIVTLITSFSLSDLSFVASRYRYYATGIVYQ